MRSSLRVLLGGALLPLLLCLALPLSARENTALKPGTAWGPVIHLKGMNGGKETVAGRFRSYAGSGRRSPARRLPECVCRRPAGGVRSPAGRARGASGQRGHPKEHSLPDGTALRDHLSTDTCRMLEAQATRSGLPMEQLQTLKPWMPAQMISLLDFTRRGFKPEPGIDACFEARASPAGKPVLGAETAAFQMGLFASLPAAQQEELPLPSWRIPTMSTLSSTA